jgi:predicted alternative tryptophan synthase beta-subunit
VNQKTLKEINMNSQTRFLLNETDLPKAWYNITADMPVPPTPVLHPQTLEPVTPEFLNVLFPMELIMQEVSTDRYPGRGPGDLQTMASNTAPSRSPA